MRDNPALQHIPMAVGGEGMLVWAHTRPRDRISRRIVSVDIELSRSSVRRSRGHAWFHRSAAVSESRDRAL